MTEIDRVLRRATARLMLERLFRALVVCLLVAACTVVAVRLAERFLALSVDWTLAWSIAGGAGVLGAAVWTIATRTGRLGVARVVDERAGLKEAISTAICVEHSADAWSHAARDHASEVSRRVVMRDVAPVRAPRGWFMPLIALGVFFALGLVPQRDLLGFASEREEQQAKQQDLIEAQEQNKEAEDLLAKIDSMLGTRDGAGDDEPAEPPAPEPVEPEDIRREAMAKLTSAQDRLDQLQNGEQSQTLEGMKNLMEQLRQPGPGPLEAMMKSLQQGDFANAQKQLSELAEKAASGELTEQQKKELQKQLAELSKQLEKLAEQQKELEKKLEELGLDKKLAQNPQALQKALQQAKNLTPEQKQMLEQLAKSASQCQSMCQNMAQACAGAAGGLSPEDLNLDQLAQLADEIGEIDKLSQQMAMAALQQAELEEKLAQLSECMGECEGGGQGDKMSDKYTRAKPNNSRGRGAGDSDEEETAFNTKKEKAKSPTSDDNVILGSQFVQGEQVRGESFAEFAEAVRAASESASQEIGTNQVPREFHEAVKRYFGSLQETTSGDKPKAEPVEPAPAPAPASDAGN